MTEQPREIQKVFGFALKRAQQGAMHPHTKVLRGFGGAGVLEVKENLAGNTFRAVYTVQLSKGVYVLHVFQKKSKQGSKTPKPTMDLIRQRLKIAEEEDAKS